MTSLKKSILDVQGFHFSALGEGPEDGPLVLFLHGFPEFADAWQGVMHPIAQAGFHAVAVDQRGYSTGARPGELNNYAIEHLLADVRGFADALGHHRFHLAGHDWGAFLSWVFAAQFPERILSLTAVSTPHPDAFLKAIRTDEDQRQRSQYIPFFRMPGGVAESFLLADDCRVLRSVYQGKLPELAVQENIRRLSEPGALTAGLNWYAALNLEASVGKITVPTLYIWSDQDIALGETAALATAGYVTGPYRFERLEGKTHWLLEEASEQVASLLLAHLRANSTN